MGALWSKLGKWEAKWDVGRQNQTCPLHDLDGYGKDKNFSQKNMFWTIFDSKTLPHCPEERFRPEKNEKALKEVPYRVLGFGW